MNTRSISRSWTSACRASPGLDAIRAWRKAEKSFPVLILTARDSWQEKVAGLDAGADDYVTKPFRFEEVLARVQALLRRSGGWSQPLLKSGAVELDTRSQEVRVAGNAVELTAFEYRLLEYLMLRAGQVISKTELTEKLYEQDFERDSNTIEVFIGRLRRKLDPDGDRQPIETLRGRGYRITSRLTRGATQPIAADPAAADAGATAAGRGRGRCLGPRFAIPRPRHALRARTCWMRRSSR